MTPNLRIGSIDDIEELVIMNIALRTDEEIDNVMTNSEVKERMVGFITGKEYKAYILEINEKSIVGYGLIDITRNPIYLRQLFIKKEYRNKGFGKLIINEIMKINNSNSIDIEVMYWNEEAIKFYDNIGFKKRYLGMRQEQNNN